MFLFFSLSKSWKTATHTFIGNNAFEILAKERPQSAKFYTSASEKLVETVKKGFIDPDFEEKATGTHYYVWPGECKNEGQYFGHAKIAFSRDTARTRLERHYKEGLEEYKKGNTEAAFLHIGRAGHYLMDIGCPAHASGVQYSLFGKNHHKLYEFYILTLTPPKADTAKDLYGKLDKDVLGYTLNDICKEAAKFKSNVLSDDHEIYEQSLETIPVCAQYTAVLLDTFARDAQELVKEENNTVETENDDSL